MKLCPTCLEAPHFHYARNVSMTRKADHFVFSGCRHAAALFTQTPHAIVPSMERDAIEAKWDAEAQRLFDVYTYAWTDTQRAVFRERIWPTPPPVIPAELFDHAGQPTKPVDIAAVKKWNEAHPASDEDGYL